MCVCVSKRRGGKVKMSGGLSGALTDVGVCVRMWSQGMGDV